MGKSRPSGEAVLPASPEAQLADDPWLDWVGSPENRVMTLKSFRPEKTQDGDAIDTCTQTGQQASEDRSQTRTPDLKRPDLAGRSVIQRKNRNQR
jgi:hypothetical protein